MTVANTWPWIVGLLALLNLILGVTVKDSHFNILAGVLLAVVFISRITLMY